MFDIGFFEIAVVAVVALFVVGPERLPGLVRSGGFWFGKIRYWVNSTKSEMKRELHNADVLRQEAEQKMRHASSPETLNVHSESDKVAKIDDDLPPKQS